jgi:Tfp pilus assembly protein PilP
MIQLLFITILSFAQDPAPTAQTPTAASSVPEKSAPVPSETAAPAAGATTVNSPSVEGSSFVSSLIKPFNYESANKRDPFAPPEVSLEAPRPVGLFGPLLAMQEVKLDEVKLKGIILNPTHPVALVQYPDPNKAGATLKAKISVKDYLGENFGVVSAIRDGQVIIVQTLDQGDKKSTTTRTLTIRK